MSGLYVFAVRFILLAFFPFIFFCADWDWENFNIYPEDLIWMTEQFLFSHNL